MNQIEELKTTLQSLCNISAEDAIVPAEILSKVLDVCSENKTLRSNVENLNEFSKDLISRLENASRESERTNLLEQNITELRGRNSMLENELIQKDDSIKIMQKELTNKETEIKNLSGQISLKESEINVLHQDRTDLEIIRKNYETLDIFPFYEKLSDKLKDNLSNIFSNTDTSALLSAGIQENNIMRLYDILEDRVREEIWDNYDELNEIVKRLFNLYNLGRKEPYIIIDPNIDSKTNDNEHKIRGNAISGTISKVLLFGYKTMKGEIKKKAFVEVC